MPSKQQIPSSLSSVSTSVKESTIFLFWKGFYHFIFEMKQVAAVTWNIHDVESIYTGQPVNSEYGGKRLDRQSKSINFS